MKKLGIVLIVFGLAMVLWYGYQWSRGQQSVSHLDEKTVASMQDQSHPKTEHRSQPYLPAGDQDGKDKKGHHHKKNRHKKSQGNQKTNPKPKVPDYQKSEEVATLTIPKLKKSFDVFWGTDKDTLAKGVGEYVSKWTGPPGQGGHTVLSGHNNTVFEKLGKLDDGDLLFMTYRGKDYKYKINKSWITREDDHSVIVKKDRPTLTLTTCYPFGYIKYTPKRYIVQANLVDKGKLLNH